MLLQFYASKPVAIRLSNDASGAVKAVRVRK